MLHSLLWPLYTRISIFLSYGSSRLPLLALMLAVPRLAYVDVHQTNLYKLRSQQSYKCV